MTSFFWQSGESLVRSFPAVQFIEELGRRARDNTPEDIRIAVPWFKPSRNETDLTPDYFLRETAEWLVFPHELDALTPAELQRARPDIARIIDGAKAPQQA